jgi:hypothetical protein
MAASKRLAAAAATMALCACSPSQPERPDNGFICRAYTAQASHREVIAQGTVVAVLGRRFSRSGEHEGYLLKLNGDCDLMLKVETNESITGPVPIHRGEKLIVKGEYEYDVMGGVLHWTHHDPGGRHVAGYVVSDGKTYW